MENFWFVSIIFNFIDFRLRFWCRGPILTLKNFWLHWVFIRVLRLFSSFSSWLSCSVACGILVPKSGIKPASPALEGVFFNIFSFIYLFGHSRALVMVCGIFSCSIRTLSCGLWDLAPWPGMEPRAPVLGAQSLSHWTTKEVLEGRFLTTGPLGKSLY